MKRLVGLVCSASAQWLLRAAVWADWPLERDCAAAHWACGRASTAPIRTKMLTLVPWASAADERGQLSACGKACGLM
jgi:hypothetical protein